MKFNERQGTRSFINTKYSSRVEELSVTRVLARSSDECWLILLKGSPSISAQLFLLYIFFLYCVLLSVNDIFVQWSTSYLIKPTYNNWKSVWLLIFQFTFANSVPQYKFTPVFIYRNKYINIYIYILNICIEEKVTYIKTQYNFVSQSYRNGNTLCYVRRHSA